MGWDMFLEQVEFEVGVGSTIRFWHDKWCGDTPSKKLFPVLFACSLSCDASIDSVLVRPNPGGPREWNITFIRDFNDWELRMVVSFQFLHSHIPIREGLDVMKWNLRKNGMFDVRSSYLAIRGSSEKQFPWKGMVLYV